MPQLSRSGGPLQSRIYQFDLFGPSHGDIKVVRARPELVQRERLRLRRDAVGTALRHDNEVVPDVKPDHGVIDAVTRADPGDYNRVATGTQVQALQNRFHCRFVETIVGRLLNDNFPGQWFEL